MSQYRQPDAYIVTDSMGGYVARYHANGGVMQFTTVREEAMRTTDSKHAFEVARIARELYKRPGMRMALVS